MPNRLTKGKALVGAINAPTSGISIAGTAVSATAAEINTLASVTAGTASASKAVVLDANKAVTGQRLPVLTKSADYTVTAGDSGATIIVTGVDKVMTLPATAAGLRNRFILAAAGLSAGMGNGFTSADAKKAILAGSGDREGDSIMLEGDGVDGWYIVGTVGTWTREA